MSSMPEAQILCCDELASSGTCSRAGHDEILFNTGQEIKQKLDDVRNRRFSYDGAHGSPRSASKEVCAVKEVRVLD